MIRQTLRPDLCIYQCVFPLALLASDCIGANVVVVSKSSLSNGFALHTYKIPNPGVHPMESITRGDQTNRGKQIEIYVRD